MKYMQFLESKAQLADMSGFNPLWMPEFLFDFQKYLVDWAVRKGRAAIYSDCGTGKTPMQLVWSQNVIEHTNKPVLIATPLAVGPQTVREAEKFGIKASLSRNGSFGDSKIIVTNYERLHYFNPQDFSGVVCDESGILKNFDGKRKAEVTEFMRTRPYRLLCTATAAPNDYVELGTSAEALGEMGFQDMVTRFFKKETSKDHLGWGRTKYRMRSHAERDFWRWVVSWARACRKPSDIGFEDAGFALPELKTKEYTIESRIKKAGMLFDMPAITLQDQREERRRTIPERCEKVAELVGNNGHSAVCWCHLNDEGDYLEKIIPDAVQISGKDSDDSKEEAFDAFSREQIRVLVSKPIIAGFGLNWQHCAHQTFFPSHSFEQFYQAVRRCWRFGQTKPVQVDIVTSEGEAGVLANLHLKSNKADIMFRRLISLMNDQLKIEASNPFTEKERLPSWL